MKNKKNNYYDLLFECKLLKKDLDGANDSIKFYKDIINNLKTNLYLCIISLVLLLLPFVIFLGYTIIDLIIKIS